MSAGGISRREQNRLESIAAPEVADVDLGTVTVREAITIIEALNARSRAYGNHPRAEASVALATKLYYAAQASWDAQVAAEAAAVEEVSA